MKSIHGENQEIAPEELMSAAIEGDDLVIRLPLELMIWAQRQREESLIVVDKTAMGKWLVENILEYGGDSEIGSTGIEEFLDAAFMEALESAEPWLQGWWEIEEGSEDDDEAEGTISGTTWQPEKNATES